ncbi:8-oxoguanine deaminase, partial [Chloroflexota bacterium]
LEIAIRGGASVLGRNDIGSLEASRYADFFAIKLDKLGYAGALHDPVAAVIFYTPVNADYTVVGGKFIVKDGHLKTADIQTLVQEQNIAAERLLTP